MQLIITSLKWDLEVALDRIGDAEDGAITLLDQNTELYNQNIKIERQVNDLRLYIGKMERKAKIQPFVFTFGLVAGAGGGTLMGMGIANNNIQQTLTGGGIIVGTGLIYIIGHTIFGWW